MRTKKEPLAQADVFRGLAHEHRVELLKLLGKKPYLTLDEIADTLDVNYKTIAGHLKRMELSGLVHKQQEGSSVEHSLTARGTKIFRFLKEIR